MYFIGIDIGTSSVCGVLVDQEGHMMRSLTKQNRSSCTDHEFERTQDPAVIMKLVRELLSELIENHDDIGGIGLSGQMHGILYIDRVGHPLSPLYTWQDCRGNLPYCDGLSYAVYLSRLTGYDVSTGYGLVTHFYNQQNGKIPSVPFCICTIMDYVAMSLTGRTYAVIDVSNAASLGFFNLKRQEFDTKALDAVEISSMILPKVVSGPVRLGDWQGIPVFSAIGDNQASFLGSVESIVPSVHVTVGTSSQVSVYSEHFRFVPELDTRPLPGGGYLLVGAALSGGSSYALLKEFIQDTVYRFTGLELNDSEVYDRMARLIEGGKSSDSLEVITLFEGRRGNPLARGAIRNISRSNWRIPELVSGFLRGICKELYEFYESLPLELRCEKRLIIGSGNCLRYNPVLGEILAKQFDLPFRMSQNREAAAFGASLVAKKGLVDIIGGIEEVI